MFEALRVLAMAAVTSLGLWLSYHVLVAVRTGTAKVDGDRVRRRTRPWYYWTAVCVQAGFAVACFAAIAQGLLR